MKSNKLAKHHHRFFVKSGEIQGNIFKSDDRDLINQTKNVFRLSSGAAIYILDNQNHEYEVEITNVSQKIVMGKVLRTKNIPENGYKINLFCPILKNNNLEFILQRCAEVGVNRFYPIVCDNSIIIDFNENRLLRYNKILKEATEQSMRVSVPTIEGSVNLGGALEITKDSFCVFADQDSDKTILQVASFIKGKKEVNIFVGPEGDFSEAEKNAMKKAGFLSFNLGPNVLRSETACLLASGIISQIMLK